MTRRLARRLGRVLLAGALVAGAVSCASGSKGPSGAEPSCPVASLNAQHPLKVTLWESYDAIEDVAFRQLASAFNQSHPAVQVVVEHPAPTGNDPTGYRENGDIVRAVFRGMLNRGPLPDLFESPQFPATRVLIDSGGITPAQVCIDATRMDLSDFLPQTLAESRVGDIQWGMPEGYQGLVAFYNIPALQRAGLDPGRLPETLDQLLAAAQTLAKHGVTDPITNLQSGAIASLSGVQLTDNNEGRNARPTRAGFDTPTARQVFGMLSRLNAVGQTPPPSFGAIPSTAIPALAEFAAGAGAYTDTNPDTTALKEDVLPALAQGQAPNVQLAVGPIPTLNGPGGTGTWSGNWFLTKASPPSRRAAAWTFLNWFEQPEQQAHWHERTGYFPDRRSAAQDPTVRRLWQQQPLYAQIWNLATTRPWTIFPIAEGLDLTPLFQLPPSDSGAYGPGFDVAFDNAVGATNQAIASYNANPLAAVRCYGSNPTPACPPNGAPPAPDQ